MAIAVGGHSRLEHFLQELERIDLMIQLQVLRFRRGGSPENTFRGLCLRDEEIDALLLRKDLLGADLQEEPSPAQSSLSDRLAVIKAQIADRKAASYQEGVMLRTEQLKQLFRLSDFDLDVLLICIAPEIDLRYEPLYAYLQDDITLKRPSVHLVLDILCPTLDAKVAARAHFAPTAPLMAYQLLHGVKDADPYTAFRAKSLRVDDRIVEYLTGSDQPDARLLPFLQPRTPPVKWPDLILPEEVKDRLERLVRGPGEAVASNAISHGRSEGLILYFQGPAGVGRRTTAESLCNELKIPLLVINTARLINSDLPAPEAIRMIFREVLLQQSALYFEHFDLLLAEDEKVRLWRETILEELEHLWGLTFLSGQAAWEPVGAFHKKTFIRMEFPLPSYTLRKRFLELFLGGVGASHLDVGAVADLFRLSIGQLQDAVAMAKNLARWRDPQTGHLTGDDLHNAFRAHSNQRLGRLAVKVFSQCRWSDLVLPKEQTAQLREIVSAVKHRHVVHEVWGFQRKLSLGKGLNLLFAGISGTGKTMAAGLLAGELGLDLYKIDLSMVVSKYIGETEKNLARIFAEAETSNAILFFDEADALFGKRSEVKDAHDRYANIETAYLLQKMEAYDGIVILATNLKKNMDEAFVRRMHMTIEFPFPEEESRCRIWQGIFPKEAPLGQDVDFSFLARQFNLAGGHIKNIALHAAFLAAQNGKVIDMAHLIHATKREFQKMGRLVSPSDFLGYYDLIKAEKDGGGRAGGT